jgi:hypothetical protein
MALSTLNAILLLLIQFTTGKLFYRNGLLIDNNFIKGYMLELIMVFIFIFLLILGIWASRPKRKPALFLSLCLFLPILIVYFASLITIPMFDSRYLIFSSIPYFLLVANGINRIKPKIIQFLFLGFLFFYALLNIDYCWATKDAYFREAFAYLKKNQNASESQYFVSPDRLDQVFMYYYPERASQVTYIDTKKLSNQQEIANFRRILKGKNDIRLFCFNLKDEEMGLLLENLKGYNLIERKSFSGKFSIKIEILHFIKQG